MHYPKFQIDFQVPNFKPIASSDFEMDCKFRISNRFPRPIFKPISKKGGMINITEININLKFKEYQFSRVKPSSNINIAYTNKEWVGKQVLVIPVNMNITDRYIESQYDETTKEYTLTLNSPVILSKKVHKGANIGRITLPKEWIGYDVLIIEPPNLTNF